MARSPLCSRCKIEKEPGRESQPYCKECKRKYLEEKKKEVKIVQPKVSRPRRNSEAAKRCPDCNILKESPKQAYCKACRNKRDKAWKMATGRVKKHHDGLCPCGEQRGPNQAYFCLGCKAEDSRQWRSVHRAPQEELDRIAAYKKEMAAFKRRVRRITEDYVRRGVLIKQPCEKCGTNEKVETHHDDYNKPMEVRWLCRKHHLEHHKEHKLNED